MAPGVAGAGIEPVMTFQEHKNLVTCLAPLGLHSPGTFVSGVKGGGERHACVHACKYACMLVLQMPCNSYILKREPCEVFSL